MHRSYPTVLLLYDPKDQTVSTSLQLVSLYKKGHVQDMGRWDWAMVTQQYDWDEDEKVKLLNRIADNFPCAATPIQIILQ
jgi:hypothetical protein